VASLVLPFRTNDHLLKELINSDHAPDDPIFQLTFPQRGMLADANYRRLHALVYDPGDNSRQIKEEVNRIHLQ